MFVYLPFCNDFFAHGLLDARLASQVVWIGNNDRDGGIALNEFPDVTYTNRADGSCCVLDYHAFRPKAAAAWIMNAMDSDRDGNIDASFLSACGITTHNPDASALHACFDLDGDGYINSVEFLSSFALVKSIMAAAVAAAMAAAAVATRQDMAT